MKISKEEVKHIAGLSRLSLSEEETETFGSQLNKIIEYVEQLNSLDTKNIEPTSHIIPLKNVMRDDIPKASLIKEEALKNAPDSTEKFYRVPKIIE
ncbi:MAG: Asp-tRNA(Asn)/Glu-tRNA(Gln) amidotransferase GatCAB subunit C [Thermodesulfovibrio sp.]|nr:Asp-tRNA(Asn)/Glu-tRNA(Gln) amidotransferase GatCAB subunit C [Thermodesulfovibrio sp.]